MKLSKRYFGILFFVMTESAFGQTPRLALQRIIDRAHETSVFQEQVNWDSLSHQMLTLAADANSMTDLAPALEYMLAQLGDEHGRVFFQGQVIAYYYSGQLKPHQIHFVPDHYSQIQTGTLFPFEAIMMNEQTGYLRIPGMAMGDNTQMAAAIQDAVCDLIRQGATQWILDLRYNGGGNLNPMAEGLVPILGDGPLGGAKGASKSQDILWEIRDGDFYNGGYSIQLEPECGRGHPPKVAVLTSLYTVSSGEALAIMFKGREHTRFFGENTQGMVTGTGWEDVGNELVLSISVNYFHDRTGRLYREYVDVDERIPFIPGEDLQQDTAVLRALAWLGGN